MDDQVLYISCSKQMKMEDFKSLVSHVRGVEPNQLIFVNRGVPLLETGPIPDDTIFCVICQRGGLTGNQLNLLVSTARKHVTEQTQGKSGTGNYKQVMNRSRAGSLQFVS